MSRSSRWRSRCVGASDASRHVASIAEVTQGASDSSTHADARSQIWLSAVDSGASDRSTHPDAVESKDYRDRCVVGGHAYRRGSDAPRAERTQRSTGGPLHGVRGRTTTDEHTTTKEDQHP